MDATLRLVTDAVNTASPLKLSTNLVQTTSTLKITTADNPYIDAEDNSGNNRFTVGRDPASQQVNVDFASNPSGSTTAVGAIRTYRDGTNLSEAMTFIEDGSVGIGTTAPVGILDLFKSAAATRLAIRGDAGQNRLISYRTGALQRFGLYVNNTAESGSNAGSDFAIRAYNDAGTLLSTPLFIQRSTGNVGIGTTAPNTKLNIVGAGSTAASKIAITNTSTAVTLGLAVSNGISQAFIGTDTNHPLGLTTNDIERVTITAAGNVGIGTTAPAAKLDVSAGTNLNLGVTQLSLNNFPGDGIGLTFSRTTSDDDLSAIGVADSDKLGIFSREGIIFATGGSSNYSATSEIARFTTNGLTFNGDTAAANALDDYEEGTFTPNVQGTTTVGTATYSVQSGFYTKIGRSVNFQFYIVWTGGTGTGDFRIGGLPFQSINTTNAYGACSIGFLNITNLNVLGVATAYVDVNNTIIELRSYPAGGGAGAAFPYDADGSLLISGTYFV
jgi:hypothetical protein